MDQGSSSKPIAAGGGRRRSDFGGRRVNVAQSVPVEVHARLAMPRKPCPRPSPAPFQVDALPSLELPASPGDFNVQFEQRMKKMSAKGGRSLTNQAYGNYIPMSLPTHLHGHSSMLSRGLNQLTMAEPHQPRARGDSQLSSHSENPDATPSKDKSLSVPRQQPLPGSSPGGNSASSHTTVGSLTCFDLMKPLNSMQEVSGDNEQKAQEPLQQHEEPDDEEDLQFEMEMDEGD